MRKVVVAVMVSVLGLAGGCAEAAPSNGWASVAVPVAGVPQSLGSPAAGCIAGAVALPAEGDGYQVLRPQRNRFWGHPRTIAFVQSLARDAQDRTIGPLLIGDMSQPRGGPMAFGHGSHQNGLDVDIWFRLPMARLSADELVQPSPLSMVKGTRLNPQTWSDRQMAVLELAARSPEVDRIFVNPPIKVEACRLAKGAGFKGDGAWVAKLRPWWGHDEHFHVRLSCTPGDIGCTPQAPVPDGDGCGAEVASWNAKPTLLPDEAKDRPNLRRPELPVACGRVLGEPGMVEAGMR